MPVITRPDPVSLEEWLSWDVDEDEPPDFDEDDLDPAGSGLPWDDPARDLHRPDVRTALRTGGLRAQHLLRQRRPHVPV